MASLTNSPLLDSLRATSTSTGLQRSLGSCLLRRRSHAAGHLRIHHGPLGQAQRCLPVEPSVIIIVTRGILLIILNELSRFIVVFKYLVSDEAWVGQPGEEVKNQRAEREYDHKNQDYDTI